MISNVLKKPTFTRDADTEYNKFLDKIFLQAEVFVSTNVTEYYFAGTDQEFWHIDKHFPNLAPVFDSFWIETKAPTHINSKVHGVQSWDHEDSEFYSRPVRWGAWFINATADSVRQQYPEMENVLADANLPLSQFWLYTITLFVQKSNEQSVEPMWSFSMLVNKETGIAVRNPSSRTGLEPFVFVSYPMGRCRQSVETLKAQHGDQPLLPMQDSSGQTKTLTVEQVFEHEAVALLKPLLLALSFMHCRNVERVPVHPSPQQNKKRVARNLPPFNKFHTLEIGPMRKIIQQAIDGYRGRKGYTGIEMALHRVIGHFKTYTPEKPLMGHAVGTWFWAGATRGSKKRGTVMKRYEVKPR